MENTHRFQIVDYIVFASIIVISLAIGVYHALSGNRQKTTSEYLLAGKSMSFLPVAISLLVSFESSIMMLGLPGETYAYGIQYSIGIVADMVGKLLCVWIAAPLIYPLNVTSTYEYIELRFKSRLVRQVASFIGIMNQLFYMGLVLFGPAVALKTVTGYPMWISIGGMALVSVIYTAIVRLVV